MPGRRLRTAWLCGGGMEGGMEGGERGAPLDDGSLPAL